MSLFLDLRTDNYLTVFLGRGSFPLAREKVITGCVGIEILARLITVHRSSNAMRCWVCRLFPSAIDLMKEEPRASDEEAWTQQKAICPCMFGPRVAVSRVGAATVLGKTKGDFRFLK